MWIDVRKLICYACGQEIVKGKFLHCTACGVNFGENCFQTLNASLIEKGSNRPIYESERNRIVSTEEFPEWIDLGKMMAKDIFIRYLLDLLQCYPEKRPQSESQVLYQCNNCMVDVDYRIADAELYHKIVSANKSKLSELTLDQSEITLYQSIPYVKNLPELLQEKYYNLIQAALPNQLQIINMVAGGMWQIVNDTEKISKYTFRARTIKTKIQNLMI